MISVKATINITPDNGGKINDVVISGGELDELSALPIDIVGIKSQPVIDSDSADTLPYVKGKSPSNNIGTFIQPYIITVSSSNIKGFVLVFDKTNNRFPNHIMVNGQNIYNDDAMFEVSFGESATQQVVIGISDWNTPRSPFILTGVYTDMNIEVDKSNLVSFSSDIADRSDIKYPSYGCISNTANMVLADHDTQILDLINGKVLHSGISADVFLYNDIAGVSEPICKVNIENLTYDNDSKEVTLSLKDNLEQMQEIDVEAVPYDFDNQGAKPFSTLYEYLHGITVSSGFDMQSLAELDTRTRSLLENTKIEYYLLESGTLWDSWQKLCETLHLRIYVNEIGKIVCKRSEP